MINMKRLSKGFWLLVITMVFATFVSSGSFAEVKKADKQITIETLKDIDNPNAEFKVELWVDRKDATYKAGDEIVFSFKTNKDCRLTLFNVGTSGKVQLLFPNEHQKDNLVKAGTTYRIPQEGAKYMFRTQGPAGEDVVKAIATVENVTLVSQNDLKPAGAFQEVAKTEAQAAKDISIALKPVPAKKWAEAEKILKVTE